MFTSSFPKSFSNRSPRTQPANGLPIAILAAAATGAATGAPASSVGASGVSSTADFTSLIAFGFLAIAAIAIAWHLAREKRTMTRRMQALLERADCMLWEARVVRTASGYKWSFTTQPSGLFTRLFSDVSPPKPGDLWPHLKLEDHSAMDARAHAALAAGAPGYQQEFRVRKDDVMLWLQERVAIHRTGPGMWHLIGVVTDVTDSRRIEASMRANEAQVHQILARADCLLWRATVTQDGDKLQWGSFEMPTSGLYPRLFGNRDPSVGSRLWSFLKVPALPEMNERSRQALLSGKTGYEQAFSAITEQETIWLREKVSVTADGPGRWHLVGVLIDVSAQHAAEAERERLEQELQRASKLESVGVLAGGIAHDFNNILTVVIGNLNLARLGDHDPADRQRALKEAERAALRARELTKQLVTFAKGGEPVRANIRLPEILRGAAAFAQRGTPVLCEFELADDLWLVDADRGQISQVVQNLVLNAAQAMPAGGVVRLAADNFTAAKDTQDHLGPGDYVHIAVTDTGGGIAPEHLPRVFDPYFTTKRQGSGLGLAVVYSIVTKHRGRVDVNSELGRGSTFHVWLPAIRNAPPATTPEVLTMPETLRGRVLVMDDEEPICRLVRALLGHAGLTVAIAADGGEALERYRTAHDAGEPFDLVILDLTVSGGMGGLEALEHLRVVNPDLKAIVSSGYSSDPILANFRAHGFRGRVAKPYEADELMAVVRDVLAE